MLTKAFLFMGQSNAQGYGNRTQLNPVPSWAQNAANGWTGAPTVSSDSGVQYQHPTASNAPGLYNENNTGLMSGQTDGWGAYDGCNPPTGTHPGEQGSYGPELSFLARFRADNPGVPVASVKCVLGGSSIDDWLPGGSMDLVWKAAVDEAAARLAAVGITPEWAGLLWVQGESGCSTVWPYLNPTPGAEYKDKLRAFFASVRARTATTLPVVIGRLGSQMYADAVIGTVSSGIDTPANRFAATQHREDQQAEVGTDAGNVSYSRRDLPTLQSGQAAYWYHLTGAGCLADGERAYAALTGYVPPPPPPPLAVRFNGVDQPWAVTMNGKPIGGPGDVIDVTG